MSFHTTTFNQGFYEPDDNHKVWYCQSGNPDGIPVLMFHGGPGDLSRPRHLKYFDLTKFNVIQIDQRGAGQSTAKEFLKDNTTQHLLEDIEAIRKLLNIDKAIIKGGSWGSTMAILYAQAHPEVVSHLFVRNVFLSNKQSSDWLFSPECQTFFPDLWQHVALSLNELDLKEYDAAALYNFLKDGNIREQQLVCKIIRDWESNTYPMEATMHISSLEDMTESERTGMLIFLHYQANNFFIEENQVLNNAPKVQRISTAIIHGRFDMICPPNQAYALHKALPNSTLEVVQDSGHKMSTTAVQCAKQMFKNLIK